MKRMKSFLALMVALLLAANCVFALAEETTMDVSGVAIGNVQISVNDELVSDLSGLTLKLDAGQSDGGSRLAARATVMGGDEVAAQAVIAGAEEQNKFALNVTGMSKPVTLDAAVLQQLFSEEGMQQLMDQLLAELSDEERAAVEEMIKSIYKKFGHIDVLVNNAGITKDNLLMKMKEEEFDAVIDTNLKGSFNTMRHVARYMLKQKSGSIINISSVSGVLGNPGQMNYCASKAGVIGMTKSMAREIASRGIRVNAVAPGFIETEMMDQMTDAAKEAGKAQIPFGRYGKTEEIANVVAFLASEKASYITGQVICVDGGMAM